MSDPSVAVDAKLPIKRLLPLSMQHLFAMFGSTVLVTLVFHINPATVLLFNGGGTRLYLWICKGRIPAYLGSRFAFISPVLLLFTQGYDLALGGRLFVAYYFASVVS